MIKVLHILTRLDMGGASQNTLLTCRGLSDKYRMLLVYGLSLESNMTDSEKQAVEKAIERIKKRGVKTICIPSMVRRIHPLKDFRALSSLFWLMFREKPAIVHTHSSKAGILGRLAAKFAGVPIIIHTPHGHVFYGHFGPLQSRLFLWIERIFAYFTDRLVALSHGEKNEYIALSVGKPEKMLTVHSGVDIERYMSTEVDVIEKKRSLGFLPNSLLVGFVGWLLPIKGPMHLLRAMESVWEKHAEITLVYAGKGDLDLDLRAETLRMGANGRVRFLGWRDDIDEIMPLFDIFVLPSLNEGMGRVLVEAMANGKPVVASRVGGIADLVKDQKTGLLVEPGNEKALAEAILRLVNDPGQRRRMGEMGRFHCLQFSLTAMIEKLDHLYDELISIPQKIIHLKPETPARSAKESDVFSPFHQENDEKKSVRPCKSC